MESTDDTIDYDILGAFFVFNMLSEAYSPEVVAWLSFADGGDIWQFRK